MVPMLHTEGLVLRPFRAADAPAVQRHCANRKIARMTSRIPHPYPDGAAAPWIAGHAEASARDAEHSFCIERDGEPIGVVSLRKTAERVYEIGYWLAEGCWGRGYATAAAGRVLRFAFRELGAARVTSTHFLDNPASGRVLEKCGFAYTGEDSEWCAARGRNVPCRRLVLTVSTHHHNRMTRMTALQSLRPGAWSAAMRASQGPRDAVRRACKAALRVACRVRRRASAPLADAPHRPRDDSYPADAARDQTYHPIMMVGTGPDDGDAAP